VTPTPAGRLAGQGVVVTGAGRGIGRALALRAAAEGARVVVNDLDEEHAAAVAAEVGGVAVPGDAATDEGVRRVVAAATETLGAIDVYLANAGIDTTPDAGTGLGDGLAEGAPTSLDTPDAAWARMLEVNVMAHVRAARLLVPGWLERPEGQDGAPRGRFVVTASAAGLLTMLGSAPYSVTKHAAVGFAEWLSATYGARGVAVQAICPQGVRTAMLENSGPLAALLSRDSALEPEQVADAWTVALDEGRFLVLPHPEVADYYRMRAQDTDAWLGGMRRLQAKLDRSF